MAEPTKPTSKSASSDDKKSAADKKPTSKDTETGASAKSATAAPRSSSVPETGPGKPAASAAETAKVTSEKRSGFRSALAVLVVIILLAGGAFATKAIWLPSVQPYLAAVPGFKPATAPVPEGPSPVDMLAERLAALEAKVTASEADNDGQTMAAMEAERARVQGELDKALTRIGDLENRLTEVREMAQVLTSTASGRTVDLEPVLSRIDSLEQSGRQTSEVLAKLSDRVETGISVQSASSGDGAVNAAVLAIAQLRDTALAGQPYAAQLEALRALAGSQPDVAAAVSRLDNTAATGLPTTEDLASRFSGFAGKMIAIARTGDGDWLDQATGQLSSLVSIRRTDGQSGDPIEDAVAAIEARLAARDVAGAVDLATSLSDSLTSQARAMLEPWLLDAKARSTAERALNALQAAALAGLGG